VAQQEAEKAKKTEIETVDAMVRTVKDMAGDALWHEEASVRGLIVRVRVGFLSGESVAFNPNNYPNNDSNFNLNLEEVWRGELLPSLPPHLWGDGEATLTLTLTLTL